jgi:hypothetical protein
VLRYATRESLRVIRGMYYAPDIPSLARKREQAMPFFEARRTLRRR